LVLLFQGFDAGQHCSWCHYLSCVPTSKWSCKAPNNSCMVSLFLYIRVSDVEITGFNTFLTFSWSKLCLRENLNIY
jgi:hypothetical protein